MNKTELAALKERVDAASGPDRKLDLDIWLEIFAADAAAVDHNVQGPTYTAGIDAALELVARCLPGWRWSLNSMGMATLCEDWNDDYALIYWSDRTHKKRHQSFDETPPERKTTPPLAILSCLLAALIERQPEDAA